MECLHLKLIVSQKHVSLMKHLVLWDDYQIGSGVDLSWVILYIKHKYDNGKLLQL